MARSDKKSHLEFSDRNIHKRIELLKPFVEIEWLKKKPKLFFIQTYATKNSNKEQNKSKIAY